jgi:hypothetical protein
MNLDYIKSQLSKAGWKNIQPGSHVEIDFDLVGSRHFLFTKWNVLVKVLPILDREATTTWQANFKRISQKSKSFIWGKCFLLCLIAEDVSPEVSKSISADTFGLFGVFRLQGGGGNILITDLKNKQVYGKVPALPVDVHNFSQSVKGILSTALNK